MFKVAKIDSMNAVMLNNLKPETHYQVWLQAYLRNGKVIESNVLEIATNNRAVGHHGAGGGGEYQTLSNFNWRAALTKNSQFIKFHLT